MKQLSMKPALIACACLCASLTPPVVSKQLCSYIFDPELLSERTKLQRKAQSIGLPGKDASA